jgi:hypothetical protein
MMLHTAKDNAQKLADKHKESGELSPCQRAVFDVLLVLYIDFF